MFVPLYSFILKSRLFCAISTLIPLLFFLVTCLLPHIWTCYFYEYTGVECFGCGMTRAFSSLFTGNILNGINYHPFVIPLLVAWFIALITLISPRRIQQKIFNMVEVFEKKTGITIILILLFFLYGAFRMIIQYYFK